MRSTVVAIGLLLTACAPVPDDPVPVDDDAPQTPSPKPTPTPTDDVTPATQAGLAWRWVTRPDDEEFPQVRDVMTSGNIRYSFRVDEKRERATIVREGSKGREDWRQTLPDESWPGGFMVHFEGRLYVALHSHIASGARVVALDTETGDVLWTTTLRGLGPVAHSKYRNRVQMDVRDGALMIYGLESQGHYVERIDLTTGKTTDNLRVDDAVATIPWRFDAPEPSEFPGNPMTARVEADGTRFVVTYSPVATGATLKAERDAKTVWSTGLEGLGGVAHSEYINTVEVRMVDGLVVAFGRESVGRYIEARDPASGALLSSQVFWNRPGH